MIFCFSGTGNSLHTAEWIAKETGGSVTMMTETELQRQKVYSIDDEYLGFVFPIYWWGIPVQVEKFVKEMRLSYSKSPYTYAVCTYGMLGNNGLADLQKLLRKKKIDLNASFEVKMVDNYIVGYELVGQDKQKEILQKAEIQIEKIAAAISQKSQVKTKDFISAVKPIVHGFYKNKDHRTKFFVTDNCISCGKCQIECPSGAIQMIDGRPQWKKNCSFCLKCINSCPVRAVQYGKTKGRERYIYQSV